MKNSTWVDTTIKTISLIYGAKLLLTGSLKFVELSTKILGIIPQDGKSISNQVDEINKHKIGQLIDILGTLSLGYQMTSEPALEISKAVNLLIWPKLQNAAVDPNILSSNMTYQPRG